MRKSYFLVVALAAAVWTSCSQDEQLSMTNESKPAFTGVMENVNSRTELNGTSVNWKVGDEVSIFEMDNVNARYKVKSVTNGTASFDYVSVNGQYSFDLDANYAVYPFAADNSINTDGIISATVSNEYTFTDKASSVEELLMVAKSTNDQLNFKNAQGVFVLRLNAERPEKLGKIQSVKLTSESVNLSGTATISFGEDGLPVTVINDGGKELIVTLAESAQEELPVYSEENETFTDIYFPIVPTSIGDLTLTIQFEKKEKEYVYPIATTLEFKRNVLQPIMHTVPASGFTGTTEKANVSSMDALKDAAKTEQYIYIEGNLEGNEDITVDGSIQVNNGAEATIDLDGATANVATEKDYGFIAENNSELTLTDVNVIANGGAVGAIGGSKVTFNSGSINVTSTTTNPRYLFYVTGNGSEVTINGGDFSFTSVTLKRAYIYAGAGTKVVVNGGNFGKASTRSGYTAGILGEGEVVITGGTFKFNPSTWVADGYEAIQNGDTWTVSAIQSGN